MLKELVFVEQLYSGRSHWAILTASLHCVGRVNLWLLGQELPLTPVLMDTFLTVLEGRISISITVVIFSDQGAPTPDSSSKIETRFRRHLATAW